MKRNQMLSIVLIVAMLVSMFIVPTYAAQTPPTPTDSDTGSPWLAYTYRRVNFTSSDTAYLGKITGVTVNGTTYTKDTSGSVSTLQGNSNLWNVSTSSWSGYSLNLSYSTVLPATVVVKANGYSDLTFTINADGTITAGSSQQESSISLSASSVSVKAGNSQSVTATLTGCKLSSVTSGNTSIAAVSYSGSTITIKGVSAGTTTVTVSGTASNGYSAPQSKTITVKVTSSQKESSITLNTSEVTVTEGKSASVTATTAGCTISNVSSSNTGVAAVSYSGNTITINGVSAGTATVTVSGTANSGYSAPDSQTITVTVEEDTVPKHTKAISPEGAAADSYTLTLDVTGKDVTTTTSTTTPGQTTTGTNVVIVIDTSGSIIGKETELNNAIQSLVNGLPSNSQVGIVTFNDTATKEEIYTPSTISGLSFSGAIMTGTKIATGIKSARQLLQGNGHWENKDNNKAMVIISDFYADDYLDAISEAYQAKNNHDINIYSVKIDKDSVDPASEVYLTDQGANKVASFTRYISSQYPSATAVDYYAGTLYAGYFNAAIVTPGTADNSKTYVYGAAGGNWSEIFEGIKSSQDITTTTTTTVHLSGVTISDTLSDYVELDGAFNPTVKAGSKTLTRGTDYTVSVSGKTVSVTFRNELTDGTKYTASFQVKPTAKAQAAANAAAADSSAFPSNNGATLKYSYGSDSNTVNYEQEPQIIVNKNKTYTVTWRDEDGTVLETDENVPYGETPAYDGDEPEKAADAQYSYEFTGWTPELAPVTGDAVYTAVYTPTVRAYTVTWRDDDGTELETDENVPYGTTPTYDGDEPEKAADARYSYEFTGWTPEITPVTGNAVYTAVYEATPIIAYQITYIYPSRLYGEQSYVVSGTFSDAELAQYAADDKLTAAFIDKFAPYEDNFMQTLTFDANAPESNEKDGTVYKAVVRATASEDTAYVTAHISLPYAYDKTNYYAPTSVVDGAAAAEPSEDFDLINVPYSKHFTVGTDGKYSEEGQFIEAPAKLNDNGTVKAFSYWELTAVNIDGTQGAVFAKVYSRKLNYTAYQNYYASPKYGEGANTQNHDADSLTTISFLEYSRNQWNAEKGTASWDAADRMYADFVLSFNHNGEQLNTIQTDVADVEVGMVIESCGSYEANASAFETDGAKLTSFISGSGTDQNAPTKKAQKVVISKSTASSGVTLDNKNMIKYYYGFANSVDGVAYNNKNILFRAYSYIKYTPKNGDTIISYSVEPAYFSFNDVAARGYQTI